MIKEKSKIKKAADRHGRRAAAVKKSHYLGYRQTSSSATRKSFGLAESLISELMAIGQALLNPYLRGPERQVIYKLLLATVRKLKAVG